MNRPSNNAEPITTRPEQPRLGLVGLGLLGTAVAERLSESGYTVLGFDPDPVRRAIHAEAGRPVATELRSLTDSCSMMLLVLPDSKVSRQVLDELLPNMAEGTCVLDFTTGDPADTEWMVDQGAGAGVQFIDVTVAGSSREARDGNAVLFVGAQPSEDPDDSLGRLIDSLSSRQFWLGTAGQAARMKLVVNLVLGLNRLVLAEGLAFGEALGLAASQCLEALQTGPAASRVMETKGNRMLNRQYEPVARLAQHAKDVQLILDQAQRVGAELPLTSLHGDILASLIDRGWGPADNSAVVEFYRTDQKLE